MVWALAMRFPRSVCRVALFALWMLEVFAFLALSQVLLGPSSISFASFSPVRSSFFPFADLFPFSLCFSSESLHFLGSVFIFLLRVKRFCLLLAPYLGEDFLVGDEILVDLWIFRFVLLSSSFVRGILSWRFSSFELLGCICRRAFASVAPSQLFALEFFVVCSSETLHLPFVKPRCFGV